MAKIPQDQFFTELITEINKQKEKVSKRFLGLSSGQLVWKPEENSWSVYGCFTHLNMIFKYYLPKIEYAINVGLVQKHQKTEFYRPTIFGHFAVKALKPVDGLEIKGKMKSPEIFTPKENDNVESGNMNEIKRFLVGEDVFIEQIMKAPSVDFNRIKIKTAIKFYKLSIGDSFRFILAHNERHILQASKILQMKKFPKN